MQATIVPTSRQLELHAYMLMFQAEHGAPPSAREIAEHFGWASVNSVWSHFKAMQRKGLVRHYPGRARGRAAVPVEVLSGIESQRESQRERHGDGL